MLHPQRSTSDDPMHNCWNHNQQSLPPLQNRRMPDHWKVEFQVVFPLSTILKFAFMTLCTISLGHNDLEGMWDICLGHEEIWTESKDRVLNRISTITVVAGLLLGSIASFATSDPPVRSMLNYNAREPYMCLLLAFGLTLGGLIVGSALLFGLAKCSASYFRDTLMGTRSSICCTLTLLAYPFVCIGVATSIGATGLFVAAWNSKDRLFRIGFVFVLLIPVSLVFVFAWTQRFLGSPPSHDRYSNC